MEHQRDKWIRNLAKARYDGNQWIVDDPESARLNATTQIDEIIGEALEEAIDAAEIFNFHAEGKKTLRILPIQPDSATVAAGFIMLLGRTQIKILQVNGRIETALTLMRGYRVKSAALHTFDPIPDAFGNVQWLMDRKELLTRELIIKKLLEELVRVDGEIA